MKMPIRRHFSVLFLIALLLATFAVPSFATEPAASSAALHWFDNDGRPLWVHPFHTESSPASATQNPTPLPAERWVDSMSALSFPTLEGGVVNLAQIDAPATILDFWATWCGPCRQELPHLEQMYERLKDRGLVAWAINAEESVPVIRSFVRELGLNLPIGRYTSSLDDQIAIRTLPTVLLLDREGRVRKRWDGYVRGLEAQIAAETEALLSNPDAPYKQKILARIESSSLPLRALWYRQSGSRIEALATDRPAGQIVVARQDDFLMMERDGSLSGQMQTGLRLRRMTVGDLDGDDFPEVVGWASGGSKITVIKALNGEYKSWSSPAPVLDLALIPNSGEIPAAIRLATLAGVFDAALDGRSFEPVGTHGAILSMLDREVDVLLLGDGRVARGETIVEAPADTGYLVDGGTAGWGTLPEGARRVLALESNGETRHLAVLHPGKSLQLLDAKDGSLAASLVWPQISAIAALDLDGDGVDELLVAAADRLAAISLVDSVKQANLQK